MSFGLRENSRRSSVQLNLGSNRDPLPRCHRERSGDEAGKSGEAHCSLAGICAGDAEDQTEIADEPIVDAQHRSTGPTPGNLVSFGLQRGGVG
jgi:hypothetical protein